MAAPALPVAAKSFELPGTDVEIVLERDGSLTVTERITFSFDGAFSGAFREVPLGAGEAIADLTVSEGGAAYAPGGCTELGCSSPAGTFGTLDLGNRMRVVWHYSAFSEDRTFTIAYRMTGVTKVYDDVVDVQFQVWGDEWDVRLEQVTARLDFPSVPSTDDLLIWGHPAGVEGTVSLGPDGASPSLEGGPIPPGQFVEMRVVLPRSVIDTTDGATVVAGDGRDLIMADENRALEIEERRRRALRALWVVGGLALFLPATVAALFIYLRHGREPRVDYDREYEQAPPSEHPPALVQSLLTQGSVDEEAFTATVFDLIRQGVLDARPVTTERSTWMGLRTEDITDLELSVADTDRQMKAHERSVVTVMRRILDDGPQPLHVFRERIRDDATANASTYEQFKKHANHAVVSAGLLDRSGLRTLEFAGLVLAGVFVLLVAAAVVLGDLEGGGLIPLYVLGGFLNTVIFAGFVAARRTWVRRTPDGAMLAARWKAFRSYLRDFSRLEEAPPIALDLWDSYLVYAIALGVAEEVLAAARLHAPQELEQVSHIYWYGSHGYTGGPSENAFAGLTSALSGAFTPPSSGGGGGFSSGGGGGGGGGGGAW